MRGSRILLLLGVLLLAARADAAGSFRDSPHRAPVPLEAPCEVAITPENAATALPLLANPALRVFCVVPGDYRAFGRIDLRTSGSPGAPRILRHAVADGRKAIQRPDGERAIFEALRLRASWWVVHGLTILPQSPATSWFVVIEGGDHNVIDGNVVDGFEHPNSGSQIGVFVGALFADPAVHNHVQANVVRRGNQRRLAEDYIGIVVPTGLQAGADNDHNAILDNEVYDWGDAVAVADYGDPTCAYPGRPHGTIVDGNDLYITADKRIDCATGAPDPNGGCSCSENGLDVKPDPGSDPAGWTQVTNNRLWGFRPTRSPSTCGGSGARGGAIAAGNFCAGHVLVAGNAVLDSTVGVSAAGSNWVVAGNLFHDIRSPVGMVSWAGALLPFQAASKLQFQFNTAVATDNAYDDASNDTDTRCNVVVDNRAASKLGNPRGVNHSTENNFLYQSPASNFVGASNQVFATPEHSRNEPFCFWRKRWTAPELVCVPYGKTTAASPQSAVVAACDTAIGEPFGLGPITYASVGAAPEPGGPELAAAAIAALAALRRSARSPRRR